MPNSFGYRARTRSKFARPFRRHGPEHLSTYLRTYKLGQYVDIVANGAIHKGMPHKQYHGKTGPIWNITPRAVGVEVLKRVNTRMVKKRIHVRIEHIRPSGCQDDFIRRRTENDRIKRENAKLPKDKRVRVPSLKRSPSLPDKEHFVSIPKTGVETITPQRYVVVL
uniref:60S ribosomal protein L21 n=1 Tax=Arcella intermedia TaxID=1963864 RepID=A0A6B2LM55_9EUKA